MDKLEAMNAFAKVVALGSYAEAARALGLTRSAVSKAVMELEHHLGARLLDRTTRLLHELPHRSPVPDEAKLLADAVNLEDFGVIGIGIQVIQLARQGDGLAQLREGMEKREQYNYWDARLHDGFHFSPIRQMAQHRLEHARQVAALLAQELDADRS